MTDVLESCRRNFGPAPRRFDDPADKKYVHVRRNWRLWLVPKEFLNEAFRRQEQIWERGVVVWAAIVQANSALFEPGLSDLPASILLSPHRYYDQNLDSLMDLASGLFDVKGTDQSDPELAEFSRVLADEYDRAPGLQVPRRLTGGRPVHHTSIWIVRKHLPQRYLAASFFPVVVDPTDFKCCFVLPSKYWDPRLIEAWT